MHGGDPHDPLKFAKVWAHLRDLGRAGQVMGVLHHDPDWRFIGVYGPTADWGLLWAYEHQPTHQAWLFGLTPHFRWASDYGDTCLLEGRYHPAPVYTPEELPALLAALGLPLKGEEAGPFVLTDAMEAARERLADRRTPAQDRAYEARMRRLESLVGGLDTAGVEEGGTASGVPPGMNVYQRRAYEAPIDELKAPPRSLNEGENNHAEVCHGVQVSVILAADVSQAGEETFGRRGMWHCSVAVWRGKPGPPARPIPVAKWTPAQLAAAEQVAIRNLTDIGEGAVGGRALRGEKGEYALHCFLPMNPTERAGLGLP